MTNVRRNADRRSARNSQLLAAERELELSTRDAEIEFSETVSKLRERFENDLAEATAARLARVTPAQTAYNAAVIAAEHLTAACSWSAHATHHRDSNPTPKFGPRVTP